MINTILSAEAADQAFRRSRIEFDNGNYTEAERLIQSLYNSYYSAQAAWCGVKRQAKYSKPEMISLMGEFGYDTLISNADHMIRHCRKKLETLVDIGLIITKDRLK